uniref:DNA polymerase theta n=1 Tax=Timema poppense TaxID=170557 RepID=A0A7R9D6V8_TIMPO|nr:unnamed protein product [Timema poppensis]
MQREITWMIRKRYVQSVFATETEGNTDEHTHTVSPNSKTEILPEDVNKEKECNVDTSLLEDSGTKHTSVFQSNLSLVNTQQKLELKSWGLPEPILKQYESRNVVSMFPWQVECLSHGHVLSGGNLVYSAPTSAGKTLVAEILTIKTVLERKKKALIILPFVSVVREKMFYFQDLLETSGVRVEGLMGGHSIPGGFKSVDIAICTIEKANSLINRLLEEGSINDIGIVVVDELHLLGDPFRGYLLELLLTKIRYMCLTDSDVSIQVVGMSATLPNLPLLAQWLNADLYQTDFRPVPLQEFLKVGATVYNREGKKLYDVQPKINIQNDPDHLIYLCLEAILAGHSSLIFCPTKVWCEKLAQHVAQELRIVGNSGHKLGAQLREQLSYDAVVEVLEQLKRSPAGLDKVLQQTVAFGVAFHHAGLTLDERDIIEGSFRNGTLRVLVATSTLSSGVNLPARRVIIRSPVFHGQSLEAQTYRQMIGRAGRMGRDTAGESFLMCQKSDQRVAELLIRSELQPIKSCLGEGRLSASLKRAILEVIASGVACTPEQVQQYANSTLLAVTSSDLVNPLVTCVTFLSDSELIRLQKAGEEQGAETTRYVATPLGRACLAASLPPDQGLDLFRELSKARQCFVLENDLHIIYQVTPYSVASQWGNLDWLQVLTIWEHLPVSMKKVGELVGVEERFMVRAMRGTLNVHTSKQAHKLSIHRRFYTALALQDLVNEVPLNEVAAKFMCSRGMLQSLQQSAATFAGMVTAFCRRLGWSSFELMVSQFQDRLQFGVHRELCDLMRLDALNGPRARALFEAGFTTIAELAAADVSSIENALHKGVPFQTAKELDGETSFDTATRNKLKNVWVTGRQGLTEREAASLLIKSARDLLRKELGFADVKWKISNSQLNSSGYVSGDSIIISQLETSNRQLDVSEVVDNYLKSSSKIKKNDIPENLFPVNGSLAANSKEIPLEQSLDEVPLNSSNNKRLSGGSLFSESLDDDSSVLNRNVLSVSNVSLPALENSNYSPLKIADNPVETSQKENIILNNVIYKAGENLNRSLKRKATSPLKEDNTDAAENKAGLSEFKSMEHTNSQTNNASSKLDGGMLDIDNVDCQISPKNKKTKLDGSIINNFDDLNKYFASSFNISGCQLIENCQELDLTTKSKSSPLLVNVEKTPRNVSYVNKSGGSSDMFSPPVSDKEHSFKSPSLFGDSFVVDSQLEGVLNACQDVSKKLETNKLPETKYGIEFASCVFSTPIAKNIKTDHDGGHSPTESTNDMCHDVETKEVLNPVSIQDDENINYKLDQIKRTKNSELNVIPNETCPRVPKEFKGGTMNRTDAYSVSPIKRFPMSPESPQIFHHAGELDIESPTDISRWLPSTTPEETVLCRIGNKTKKGRLNGSSTEHSSKIDGKTPQNDLSTESFSKSCDMANILNSSDKNNITRNFQVKFKDESSINDDNLTDSFLEQAFNTYWEASDNEEDNTVSDDEDVVLSSQENSEFGTTTSPWKLKSNFSPLSSKLKASKTQTITEKKTRKPPDPDKFPSAGLHSTSSKNSDQRPSWSALHVIDVCGDRRLFDTFSSELPLHPDISVSVACERHQGPKKTCNTPIGSRIARRTRLASSCAETEEWVLTSEERRVVGVALCLGGEDVYYISLNAVSSVVPLEERLGLLETVVNGSPWLTSLRIFDFKEQMKVLARCCSIHVDTPCADDPKIADWLLEPEGREKNLQAMVRARIYEALPRSIRCVRIFPQSLKYCEPAVTNVTELAGNVKGVGSPALEVSSKVLPRLRASAEAVVTWQIVQAQRSRLQENKLADIYREVEMPTLVCLARMELTGLRFSREEAEKLRSVLEKQMLALEEQAYKLAGHTFSLTSPADVAKTVFPLLNTNTGERMFGRCLMHTATGRISMHEPNLQNIPRDFDISPPEGSDVAVSMRLAFVPSKGNIFVSADYSQLELRLLAHFSGDTVLRSILNSGQDVFTSIAAAWNKIPHTQVRFCFNTRSTFSWVTYFLDKTVGVLKF